MPSTVIRGQQIKNDDVGREDLNVTTTGRAVITKIIAGNGISLTQTGVDAGTGDVTITGGITTLNTLTATTQTFATGTTGTDFNISSATSTHTFNIPSASSTARGLVTTGNQSFAGDKTFLGTVAVSPGTAASPFVITSTATSNAFAALTINATSGSRGAIVTTNGQAQYAARITTLSDRELRFQLFTDGHCYFGMQGLSGTITSDLIIRTSADSGTNNGAIRFSLSGTNRAAITSTGIAIGSQAGALTANAYLHLMAGTSAANTAPLRFTAGTNLTTPVGGAVEFDGSNLFFTPVTTRYVVPMIDNFPAVTDKYIFYANASGRLVTASAIQVNAINGLSINTPTSTAFLTIVGDGNAAPPIQIEPASLTSTAIRGSLENDGSHLYYTEDVNSLRRQVACVEPSGTAPATTAGTPTDFFGLASVSSGANYLSDPDDWIKVTINGVDHVIPAYKP